nr:PAS domain S-box protein [Thermoflexales bacterium]
MAFDIRTVILVLAAGNLVIGLILLFFQFGTERTQRIPFLATGKLLQGVGWLLLYERGWLPDFVSFTLGNIVLIVGTAYDSWAMYWISQRPVSRARQVSSAVFVVAVCLIATPLSDAGRVAVTSFTVMIFFALGGRAMLSALDRRSLLRRHIGWSMWLMVAVISVRGLWATLAPEQFTLFSANTIQLVMFAILYYLMLTNSSGMLLLAKQSADRELRDSEARYRLLAENVGDVIWKMNPVTNRFTYVSPSVQKQRGYTAAEVLAEPVCAALTAESYAAASAALPERLAAFLAQNTGSATYTNELDQPCKDGSIIHTEVVTTYAHNEHGEVEVIGVSRDITARQRAEAALRESEAKYRFLTENIKDVIWTLDVETLRYLYVSPSVTPWLGYTPEEFMAEPFGATLDPQATRYVRE